jgi:hypothetical protein
MTMEEITKDKYERLVEEEKETAKKKLAEMGWSKEKYIDVRWLVSEDYDPPCRYDDVDEYSICPISGKNFKRRPVPQKFNRWVKSEVNKLVHAADEMCHHLTLRSVVRCYAEVEIGGMLTYYKTEHKVGKCPHKGR